MKVTLFLTFTSLIVFLIALVSKDARLWIHELIFGFQIGVLVTLVFRRIRRSGR